MILFLFWSPRLNILLPILVLLFLGVGVFVYAVGSKEFVRFADCPASPNCVSSLVDPQDKIHYISPYLLSIPAELAFSQILNYLENQKNVKILKTEDGIYIHAVFISKFMRFKDDVEFYIQADDQDRAVVDIRSSSRVGYSDLGVNRNRMEEIRGYLNGLQ